MLRACFEKIQYDIIESGLDWWKFSGRPSVKNISESVFTTATRYHRHRKLLIIAISEVSDSDVVTRKLFESIINHSVKGLAKYIRDCQAAGFTDKSLLPTETALWLTATATRVYQQTAGVGNCSLEEFTQEFSRYFYAILFSVNLTKN